MQTQRRILIALLLSAFAPTVFSQQTPPGSEVISKPTNQVSTLGTNVSANVVNPVRLSEMLGSDVKTQQGESLGSVEDLVINPQDGQIQYAIVGQKGLAGVVKKQVPVPWPSASLHSELEVILNTTREQFESVPPMGQTNYANVFSLTNLLRIFGLDTNAAAGSPGPGPGGTEGGQGSTNIVTPP